MTTMTNTTFNLLSAPLSVPTLLEASAGTGKTYTIQHLVVRFVTERRGEAAPFTVDDLCLVTFTKDATAELKARIRKILNAAALGFSSSPLALEGLMADLFNEWRANPLRLLTPSDVEGKTALEIERLLIETASQRLSAARDAFDDIKIRTIHGFCNDILSDFAFEAGINLDATLEEDLSDFILDESEAFLREVLPNIQAQGDRERLAALSAGSWMSLYLGATTLPSGVTDPRFTGVSLTHIAINGNIIGATTPPVPVTDVVSFYRAYCREVPTRVRNRLREAGLLGYSDLLTELYRVTHSPTALDPSARDRLIETVAQRYRCVMIDEFQDTDPIQYAIFKALFMRMDANGTLLGYDTVETQADPQSNPSRALFFVGDPKQSIYRFRAADLDTYFEARETLLAKGGVVQLLDTNWRSSPKLIDATNHFFTGTNGQRTFVHPKLDYVPVKAGQKREGLWRRNDTGWMSLSPLEVWMGDAPISSTDFTREEPKRIAEQVAALINAGSKDLTEKGTVVIECDAHDPRRKATPITVTTSEGSVETIHVRALEPGDFAVLVRTRSGNADLTAAFDAVGLEVKTDTEQSIFATSEALDLFHTLEAIRESRNTKKVDRYLSSLFKGAQASDFVRWRTDDAAWSVVRAVTRATLEAAHRDWQDWGLARALAPILYSDGPNGEPSLMTQLARQQGGEATLIHIEHLVDVLNEASQRFKTPDGLMSWFADQLVKQPTGDRYTTRVHGDENRVQLVTVHKSKGLEYPIVFLYGDYSAKANARKNQVNRFSSTAWAGVGVTTLTTVTEISSEESVGDVQSEAEEARRLAYVAITRAKYRCVISMPVFATNTTYFFSGFEQSAYANILFAGEPSLFDVTADKPVADFFKKLKKDEKRAAVMDWMARCREYLEKTRGFTRDVLPAASHVVLPTRVTQSMSAPESHTVYPHWGRKSFSKITAHGDDATYRGRFGQESKDVRLAFDLLDFPRGAAAGTALHELFEVVAPAMQTAMQTEALAPIRDVEEIPERTAAASSTARFLTTIEYRLSSHHLLAGAADGKDGFDLRAIQAYNMLVNVLMAPITLKAGNAPLYLKDLSVRHQAHERTFTFAIPKDRTLKDLLVLLKRHGYSFEGLDAMTTLKGFMTGAIDMMFFDKATGWWVLDWKSNMLSENASGYTRPAMDREMTVHHYRLQYLIYWVALKRHVDSLKAFGVTDPALLKLGGAVYVFLRGVNEVGNAHPQALPPTVSPAAVGPQVPGLYVDQADADLIDALMAFFFPTK